MGVPVFISYAHADRRMLDRLHVFLQPLRRDETISTWVDRDVMAGRRFKTEISEALESSRVFLALLSPDYLFSSYCYEVEFKRAQALEEAGRMTIIPIILEPCDWLSTPFEAINALPRDGKPISSWRNENEALLEVVRGIRKSIERLLSAETRKSAAPQPSTLGWSTGRGWRTVASYVSSERIQNPRLSTSAGGNVTVILNEKSRIAEVDVKDGSVKTIFEIPEVPPPSENLLASHNNVSVYSRVSGDLGLITYDPETGDLESETIPAHGRKTTFADFNHDASRFISGDAAGEVHFWDWPNQCIKQTFSTVVEAPVRAALSLDEQHLAIIGRSGEVELFHLPTEQSLARAAAVVRGKRAGASFSLDGRYLAAFDDAERWDVLAVPTLIRVPEAEWDVVMLGLRGSVDGTAISCTAAGSVAIVRKSAASDDYERDEIAWTGRRATDMDLAADGRHIAVIFDRRELYVYAPDNR